MSKIMGFGTRCEAKSCFCHLLFDLGKFIFLSLNFLTYRSKLITATRTVVRMK